MLFPVAYAIIDACLRTVFVAFEKDCVKRMVVIRLQSTFSSVWKQRFLQFRSLPIWQKRWVRVLTVLFLVILIYEAFLFPMFGRVYVIMEPDSSVDYGEVLNRIAWEANSYSESDMDYDEWYVVWPSLVERIGSFSLSDFDRYLSCPHIFRRWQWMARPGVRFVTGVSRIIALDDGAISNMATTKAIPVDPDSYSNPDDDSESKSDD